MQYSFDLGLKPRKWRSDEKRKVQQTQLSFIPETQPSFITMSCHCLYSTHEGGKVVKAADSRPMYERFKIYDFSVQRLINTWWKLELSHLATFYYSCVFQTWYISLIMLLLHMKECPWPNESTKQSNLWGEVSSQNMLGQHCCSNNLLALVVASPSPLTTILTLVNSKTKPRRYWI